MRKKITIYSFSLFLIFLLEASAGADIVKLKNGRKLEGAIVSESKEAIVIDIGVGEASINRNDISSIERDKEDNAAIYYTRAINFATYIEPGEMKKNVEKIRKDKWKADEKEVEAILKENQKCLEEINKALAIKKCDFYFEQKYRHQTEKEQKLRPGDVMALGWILILKGRSCESQQRFDEAVDAYISALTFASQISQSDDAAIKYNSLIIDEETYLLIKDYLNSKNVDKKNCLKILDYLDEHEDKRFSIKDLVNGGREWFMGRFQSYEHKVMRWSREHTKVDIKIRKKAENFSQELLKTATELADKYYGLFLKAAESNSDADWKSANDEYDSPIKNNKVQSLKDELDQQKFLRDNFEDLEKCDTKDVKMIVTTWLIYKLSDVKEGIDAYKEVAKEFSGLKSLAKSKSLTARPSS